MIQKVQSSDTGFLLKFKRMAQNCMSVYGSHVWDGIVSIQSMKFIETVIDTLVVLYGYELDTKEHISYFFSRLFVVN